MAKNSTLKELLKIERLKAMHDARRDNVGDKKIIYVYEILKIRVRQKNRYIQKKYYKLIYKEKYTYSSQFDEVVLYQHIRNRISKTTPFALEIQLKPEAEEIDPLIVYYNKRSEKYYNKIITDQEYDRKKAELIKLEKELEDVKKLIDYIMLLEFDC